MTDTTGGEGGEIVSGSRCAATSTNDLRPILFRRNVP